MSDYVGLEIHTTEQQALWDLLRIPLTLYFHHIQVFQEVSVLQILHALFISLKCRGVGRL